MVDAIPQTNPPEHDDCPVGAWQPLTPVGVAAFATAPLGRLVLTQTIFAVAAAIAIVWFLRSAWCPPITDAIEKLPMDGSIRLGTLDWRGERSELLGENRFLGFLVNLDPDGEQRSFADLRLEFSRRKVRTASIAGHIDWSYPSQYSLRFNRAELQPLWGAWMPWVLLLCGMGVSVGLLLSWTVFSFVYAVPAYIACRAGKRAAGLFGCCKMAGAAQLPGALLLSVALLGYLYGALDLVRLGAAFVMHFALSWICLALAVLCLPKADSIASGSNPFASADINPDERPPGESEDSLNPFKPHRKAPPPAT